MVRNPATCEQMKKPADRVVKVTIAKASTKDAYNRNAFIYDFLSSMRQKMNDPLGQRAKNRKAISQR